MYTYTYSIEFDKDIIINTNLVIKKITSVLEDKRGWKRLGYNFYHKDKNPKFKIKIVKEEKIIKACKFSGLSCADMSTNTIYINIKRWRNGSKRSKLSLDDYRTYILNHEIGHLIGRDHVQCNKSGSKVAVMVQQTLGISDCKPNPWPLYWE
jgi:hypothetical protein